MSLRANANFQIQQSPWDLTRANLQLDLTIWSRTLSPPSLFGPSANCPDQTVNQNNNVAAKV